MGKRLLKSLCMGYPIYYPIYHPKYHAIPQYRRWRNERYHIRDWDKDIILKELGRIMGREAAVGKYRKWLEDSKDLG